MKSKRWLFIVLGIVLISTICIATFNIIIDPFFHYHKGLAGLQYPLNEERYQNDGIQRQYDYEIMLTGTSMTWNFNASKAEELWGKRTIKTAYSGATYHELGQSMRNALRHNENIKIIICSLDPNKLGGFADEDTYEGTPKYLFDDNPFNDVNYLLNKDVIVKSIAVLNYTRAGNKTTSMDEYGRFDTYQPSGYSAVMKGYERMDEQDLSQPFTDEDRDRIYDNIMSNYVDVAKDNPQVHFIFYVPPYSYCYWDALVRTKQLDYSIESLKYAVSLMVEQENISVYAFDDWTDVTTNLDYYTDTLHYTGVVCDRMLESVWANENKLDSDTYQNYYQEVKELYQDMDYRGLSDEGKHTFD